MHWFVGYGTRLSCPAEWWPTFVLCVAMLFVLYHERIQARTCSLMSTSPIILDSWQMVDVRGADDVSRWPYLGFLGCREDFGSRCYLLMFCSVGMLYNSSSSIHLVFRRFDSNWFNMALFLSLCLQKKLHGCHYHWQSSFALFILCVLSRHYLVWGGIRSLIQFLVEHAHAAIRLPSRIL